MKRIDMQVSVVVLFSDWNSLVDYIPPLQSHLNGLYTNYEIIIVDNHCEGFQISLVNDIIDNLPCVRILRLSRTYDIDTVITAGIQSSIGDCTLVLDSDTDPIDCIQEVVSLTMENDVVQGVSDGYAGKSLMRKLFFWYVRKAMDIDVDHNATYLVGLTRRATHSMSTSSRHDGHIRHLIRTLGYGYAKYEYKIEQSARTASIKRSLSQGINVITSHSTHPLRVMSMAGLMASGLNVIYIGYIILIASLKKNVAEGWTTMSLQMSLMFLLIFIFLAILSEYIGKILTEARDDSRYNVLDELTSKVTIANVNKRNVELVD